MGNVNLNGIFNYIAIKPCLSWFYFTTISMVTIWPNGIIPCSCTHIYRCFQKSPPPTPASHWPLHLWLWLTYPWLSGYQPFEIWHQTFCIVRVLDRAFFWPLFGISSLTTHCIYYFFKSIFSDPFWVFFSNWNLPLLNICLLNKWLRIYESHIFEMRIKTLDLLQSLLTHLVNMWTFFFPLLVSLSWPH